MAMLITITTLSMLIALTVEFQRSSWQSLSSAANSQTLSSLKAISASGVEIGQSLLEADIGLGEVDTLQDIWAVDNQENLQELFTAGTLDLRVEDLSGRLQLSSLLPEDGEGGGDRHLVARDILLRLLSSGVFVTEDEEEARVVVDSLVDWLDADDRESDYGAEESYYNSLDIAHSCRNGPVQYPEELLLIRGITPELLFGDGEKEALLDYLNIHGEDGKININTAPKLLVQSFDATLAEEIVVRFDEYRRNEENAERLGSLQWYREIEGWPGDVVFPEELIGTNSSLFHIVSAARSEALSLVMSAFVRRQEDGQTILLAQRIE
jgi:general secretion pathway protein K